MHKRERGLIEEWRFLDWQGIHFSPKAFWFLSYKCIWNLLMLAFNVYIVVW
jgi:hypothetical protein